MVQLLFAIFLITNASAVRLMKVPAINTPTGSTQKGSKGANSANLSRLFSLINLSDVVQNVKIRTKNIKLGFGTCDPSAGGNWVQSPENPACKVFEVTISDFEDEIILQAGESKELLVRVGCDLAAANVTNCEKLTDWIGPSDSDMDDNSMYLATAAHEIEITQDKGAIIVNILAAVDNGYSEFKNNTRFNIAVNGGRAF